VRLTCSCEGCGLLKLLGEMLEMFSMCPADTFLIEDGKRKGGGGLHNVVEDQTGRNLCSMTNICL